MSRQEDRWNALYEVRELVKAGQYVVLDVESTSLDGEVIQLAVIDSSGDILMQGLVKPQGKVTEEARAIHHIPDEWLVDAPTFDQVAPVLWPHLEGRTVVAYNADFERDRLYTSLSAVAGDWRSRSEETEKRLSWLLHGCDWWCAMQGFAAIYGDLHPYFHTYVWQRLHTACNYVGLDVQQEVLHDAATDARLTAQLIKRLTDLAERELPIGYHSPRNEPCAGGCGQTLGPFSYNEDPTWYCTECGLKAGINILCLRCEQMSKRTIVSSIRGYEQVPPGTLCYPCQYDVNIGSGAWHLCPGCTRVVQASVTAEPFCARCRAARERARQERRERKAELARERLARYALVEALVQEGKVEILAEQPLATEGLTLAYHPECITDDYLTRGDVEPILVGESGEQATLVLLKQGVYRHFHIPYIEHRVVCTDPHYVVVLVAYHSAYRYPTGGGKFAATAKGQFYRFYQHTERGWEQSSWRRIGVEERTHLAALCQQEAPTWARPPGASKQPMKEKASLPG